MPSINPHPPPDSRPLSSTAYLFLLRLGYKEFFEIEFGIFGVRDNYCRFVNHSS